MLAALFFPPSFPIFAVSISANPLPSKNILPCVANSH
jgi:hypothetical protein